MKRREFLKYGSSMMIGPGIVSGLIQTQKTNKGVLNLTSWSDIYNRKVIGFGDSIMFGTAATPLPQNAWFTLFTNANNFYGINNGIPGQLLSNDGTHTPYFDSTTIPTWNDSYGMLIMNLGINDARDSVSTMLYQSTLDSTIATAISQGWPPNRILIMALYWINLNISGYVSACLTIAQKYHTMYADMKTLIAAACNPATQYISGDNVHPTTAGHEVIFNIMQTLSLTTQ